MITREQVLDVYETVVEQACNFRQAGQEVVMTFFLILPDKTLLLPREALPDDKDDVLRMVRAAATYFGARYVVQVGEAWVSCIADGKAPSEQPDRMEAIIVTVDGPGLRRMTTIPILPGNTLGERQDADEFGGRFTSFTDSEDYN